MDSYGGRCISGPYNGDLRAYPGKKMPVVWIVGVFMREGYYEFGDGVWLWSGPAYRAPVLSKHNEFNPAREYPGSYGSAVTSNGEGR